MPPEIRRHFRFTCRRYRWRGARLTGMFSAVVDVVRSRNLVGNPGEQFRADGACRALLRQKGRIRIGVLLVGLVLGIAVHLGIQAVPAYVSKWYLAEDVRRTLRDLVIAPERVDEARRKILAKADELNVPVSGHQIVLTVDPERVAAQITWEHQIGLFGVTFTLPLEIKEVRALR